VAQSRRDSTPAVAGLTDAPERATGLGRRYALALYACADEAHAIDATVADMEKLGQAIVASEDLQRLIASPLIDPREAERAMAEVMDALGLGTIVKNFVGVVIANRRLRDLPGLIGAFAALVAERRGVVTAEVVSAKPLDERTEQTLRARLIEAGYGNVHLVKAVDPSLLGGLVVRIGTRLYDSSLKSRLQRLHYAMKGAA
jgi:F-type H+-transporting ATPase subunit delta